MVEIMNGDTAFMINKKAQKAWWIVGECRRSIPIEKLSKGNRKIRLGSRQIKLQQQFRFDLANDSISVSVFNSVRGGWSPVDVKRNDACQLEATCRSRMELPEC